ncbi:unnamed protein product [Darwinula stevensoni]|uniref:Protein kinase domain-containing protein n=1 Tax=Darwinula stevensoni TaxID=69355 RepID=A0A7R9A388_9CRUS|nr:unnamed protein product [Darwinula stevensoni]CAG0887301.1 unnamed protein product [Darwinula stevensoni]
MEDIFQWCREGNAFQVRVWLDDTENDLNQGDDHGFSPLHWAAREGRRNIVEMLIQRGARINATNRGDDTALHLAAAHGHRDIVHLLLRNKADINFINEHGNAPLHYACFWSYNAIAEDLVNEGALVSISNKYGETPLDKCKGAMAKHLHDLAVENGQDLKKVGFKDQSWLGLKTRSRDATLSRHKGIAYNDLHLEVKIGGSPSGDVWRGRWQGNEIVAKVLAVREITPRVQRAFNEEFPKLRIFSHPNILPVIGACTEAPQLYVISQYMPHGSLFNVLHGGRTGIVLDMGQILRFSSDIARGMAYLHSLEKPIPRVFLNSKHVMIDEDLTARIHMGDAKFSFQEKGKIFSPQWVAPEALQKKAEDINVKAADMWSYAILLWELATRQVPFAEYSPMEAGMKVALEGLRVTIHPGISQHMAKLLRICMNEDPGKRPNFDMLLPILDKMKAV